MSQQTASTDDVPPDNDRGSAPPEVDLLMEMYGWLREEINQSYRHQHRIVTGQATLVGLLFGLYYTFNMIPSNAPEGFLEFINLLFVLIPPIVIASASLWLVEHIRVMRAGNYLQLLEHKINGYVDGHPISWEAWLRDSPKRSGLKKYFSPHLLYDVCHLIAYPLFFLITGGSSLLIATAMLNDEISIGELDKAATYSTLVFEGGMGTRAYFFILAMFLVLVVLMIVVQIRHEVWDQSDKVDEFEGWLPGHFYDVPNDGNAHFRYVFQEFEDDFQDLSLNGESYQDRFQEIIERAKRWSIERRTCDCGVDVANSRSLSDTTDQHQQN